MTSNTWFETLQKLYKNLQSKIPHNFDPIITGELGISKPPKIDIDIPDLEADLTKKTYFNTQECENLGFLFKI